MTAVMALVIAIALPLGYARERGETVTVSGTVTYKGAPVKGAGIYLNELSLKRLEKMGKTDKNGRYSFDMELSALDVSRIERPAVIAYHPKYSLAWQQLFHATALDIIDLSLEESYPITGTVTDTSGNPVKDAEVSFNHIRYLPDGVYTSIKLGNKSIDPLVSKTDRNGQYSIKNLPAGSFGFISARGKGYAAKGIDTGKNGAGENFDFMLDPESVIKER